MPLISVVIPVYNGERTIQKTIESVLNQSFQDFELLIVNDGSQDATLEIIEGIQDSRIQVFSYTNAGQATSRNRGFSHSVGEFIAFLDADDVWTPDKIEAQLQALLANPQAAVAYSWTDSIDEVGQFLRRGSRINLSGEVYKHLLLMNFLENGSNPLIRRQAFIEVGDFDESLTPAEDWDMWLRLAARYEFVAVPSVQILYRVSAHSSSFNLSKLEDRALNVINRAFAQTPESLQPLKRHSLANLYKYLLGKALEDPLERHRSLVATQFLWLAIRNDPSLLRARVLLKVLLRIVAIALFAPHPAQMLLAKTGKFSDVRALYGYLRLDPS